MKNRLDVEVRATCKQCAQQATLTIYEFNAHTPWAYVTQAIQDWGRTHACAVSADAEGGPARTAAAGANAE